MLSRPHQLALAELLAWPILGPGLGGDRRLERPLYKSMT